MDLSKYTTRQLEEELDRRTKEKEHSIPTMRVSFNLVPLQNKCQEYIDWLASGKHDKDKDEWQVRSIYEIALETFFGEDIFGWWNEITK